VDLPSLPQLAATGAMPWLTSMVPRANRVKFKSTPRGGQCLQATLKVVEGDAVSDRGSADESVNFVESMIFG
jgi:hypothetical protein